MVMVGSPSVLLVFVLSACHQAGYIAPDSEQKPGDNPEGPAQPGHILPDAGRLLP